MNEKEKAEAISRARKVQPNEGPEIKDSQKELEENLAEEARLYTARGYGGYINTGEIEAIRFTTEELCQTIERLRNR